MIRNDEHIRGIHTPFHSEKTQRQVKISQYADDTVLVLHDIQGLQHCKTHIETFCKASGRKLNKDKTEGMWLGLFYDDDRWTKFKFDEDN
jgi:hypothetical protein